jgi:hypothetical protein
MKEKSNISVIIPVHELDEETMNISTPQNNISKPSMSNDEKNYLSTKFFELGL